MLGTAGDAGQSSLSPLFAFLRIFTCAGKAKGDVTPRHLSLADSHPRLNQQVVVQRRIRLRSLRACGQQQESTRAPDTGNE